VYLLRVPALELGGAGFRAGYKGLYPPRPVKKTGTRYLLIGVSLLINRGKSTPNTPKLSLGSPLEIILIFILNYF